MKKINNKSCGILFTVLTFILTLSISVSAVYDTNWIEVYSENFSSISDAEAASFTKTERTAYFDAEVNDNAFEVKSNSLCYYELNDTTSYNSAKNAHGLTLRYTDRTVERADTPITVGANSYDYYYGSDKANFIDSKEEISALKCFTYAKNAAGSDIKSNGVRLAVSSGVFESDDNALTIEIEYYLSSNDERDYFRVNYPSTPENNNGQGWINVDKSEMTVDAWKTIKIDLTDADFTHTANGDGDSLMIHTGVGSGVKSELYIRSVKIYKTTEEEFLYPTKSKVIEKQISLNPIYGNIELSFDMLLPSGIKYNDYYNYNTGHNAMEINLLDENKVKVAAIAYDFTEDEAKIYAISSDDNGESKNTIFSGTTAEILDVALQHTLTLDRENNVFSVKIEKDGYVLGNEALSCTLRNYPSEDYRCNAQYLTITHNPYSQALFSSFDNINVNTQEDLDYKNCIQEAQLLESKLPDGPLKEDFILPSTGNYDDTRITWTVTEGSGIEIEFGDAVTAKVTRPEETNSEVTLSATVEYGEYSVEKEFTFTVASLEGIGSEVGEVEETVNGDGTINAALSLKYSGVNYPEDTPITFIAVSVNSSTGEIKNYAEDEEITDCSDKYKTLDFEITSFDKKGGDKVEYYLWDEDNKSLVNTAPSKVGELSATSKVTSINLSWNGEGIDDNNKIDYYAIYRDGILINVCSDTSYTDTAAADLTNHKYEIIPVDLNENIGERSVLDNVASAKMFTYSLGATSSDEEEYGLVSQYNDSKGKVVYTTVKDKNRIESGCVYAAPGMEACFAATDPNIIVDNKITANDRNIVIRLTYLDTEGGIDMYYNSTESATKWYRVAEMKNTREWKTVVISVDDAKFSLASSYADFKFVGKKDGSNYDLYIKKVEVIQADKY